MRIDKKVLTAIFYFLISINIYAENILIIKLENRSSLDFEYKPEKTVKEPANNINIDNNKILPGKTTLIIATTSLTADLSAYLYFTHNAVLRILDQRQFHHGLPNFFFEAPGIEQHVSKVQNPLVGPRLLKVIEVHIVITNKNRALL